MHSKVRFLKTKSDVPLIEFFLLNGKKAVALIDTGSESTLFDPGFVAANKEEFTIKETKNKINLVGIEKDSETSLITLETKIYISGEDENVHAILPLSAVMMDLSHLREHFKKEYGTNMKIAAILGSDLLSDIKGKINFKEKTLMFEHDLSC